MVNVPVPHPSELSEEDLSVLDEQEGKPRRTGKEAWTALLNDPHVVARYHIMAREGRLPPDVLKQLMNYDWGRPPEKVELTGKDGGPVSVIRRVIVDPEHKDE